MYTNTWWSSRVFSQRFNGRLGYMTDIFHKGYVTIKPNQEVVQVMEKILDMLITKIGDMEIMKMLFQVLKK